MLQSWPNATQIRSSVTQPKTTQPSVTQPSDSERPTDIFAAAANGDLESVKYFVTEKVVSVDTRAVGTGQTPIFQAVQGGYLNVIEYLVDAGATINYTDKWGYHCLLWAVDQNWADLNVIKYLVSSGADVNLKDKRKGYSALHWAAFHDNLFVVNYLFEKGADIRATSVNDETPMDLAAQNAALNVVDFLLGNKGVQFDIFIAAAKGYTDAVRFFIERKGLSVDATDSAGWTPLHRAAYNGHLETIKCLVDEKGARININNKRNEALLTPLHAAAMKGHTDVVQYLVEKGANFNSRDLDSKTPDLLCR